MKINISRKKPRMKMHRLHMKIYTANRVFIHVYNILDYGVYTV